MADAVPHLVGKESLDGLEKVMEPVWLDAPWFGLSARIRFALTALLLLAVSAAVRAEGATPPGRSTAGNPIPGTTRYPGPGLRFIDAFQGPAAVTRVVRTVRFPGTSRILAVTSDTPARYSWFEIGSGPVAPMLGSQGTLPGVEGSYLRHLVIDSTRSCLYVTTNNTTGTIWKFTVSAPGGTFQPVGKLDLGVGLAAFGIDEGAGELVAVFSNGLLAKYAVGGNSALPTLVGTSGLTPSTTISTVPGGAFLLVDGPSRACLVGAGGGFYPCLLGAPGSPPIAGSQIPFSSGYSASAATWMEPGRSALFAVTNSSFTSCLARVDLPSATSSPVVTTSGPLPALPPRLADLGWDPVASRAWMAGRVTQNQIDMVFVRIHPGASGVAPGIESQWVNPDGVAMFGSNDLRDRFIVLPAERRAFYLNDNPDTLFGTDGKCLVASVDLDTPVGVPLGFPRATFDSASKPVLALAHDPGTGYSYSVVTWPSFALVKFRSPEPGGPVSIASLLDLSAYSMGTKDFAVDGGSGMGYLLGSDRIVKVNLGAGDATPTVVAELPLSSVQQPLTGPFVLDPSRGYGYYPSGEVSTGTFALRKVRLGSTTGPMEMASSMLVFTSFRILGFDQPGNLLFIGVSGGAFSVVKAGPGDSAPSTLDTTSMGTFPPFTIHFASATYDAAERLVHIGTMRYSPPPRPYGYGTHYPNPQVVRVAIAAEGDNPTVRSRLDLGPGFYGLTSMAASPRDRRAWSATALGNQVVEFDLDDPDTTGTAELTIPGPDLLDPSIAAYDDDSGVLMFGCSSVRMYSTTFLRIATRPDLRGAMRGTRFHVGGHSQVTHAHLWSHADWGNARLAIYTDTDPRVLVWNSGVVPVTADEEALTVPISAGTPYGLVLGEGDYWLCWQVDTAAGVPSYAPGTLGDSFELAMPFGPPPGTFPASAAPGTAARWTAWVSLLGASGAGNWAAYE